MAVVWLKDNGANCKRMSQDICEFFGSGEDCGRFVADTFCHGDPSMDAVSIVAGPAGVPLKGAKAALTVPSRYVGNAAKDAAFKFGQGLAHQFALREQSAVQAAESVVSKVAPEGLLTAIRRSSPFIAGAIASVTAAAQALRPQFFSDEDAQKIYVRPGGAPAEIPVGEGEPPARDIIRQDLPGHGPVISALLPGEDTGEFALPGWGEAEGIGEPEVEGGEIRDPLSDGAREIFAPGLVNQSVLWMADKGSNRASKSQIDDVSETTRDEDTSKLSGLEKLAGELRRHKFEVHMSGGPRRPKLLLDLGTGLGARLAKLAEVFGSSHDVVGVESRSFPYTKALLRHLKTKTSNNASVILGDARELPKESADVVTILHPDSLSLVEEGMQVVKVGGEIYIASDEYDGNRIGKEVVIRRLRQAGFTDLQTISYEEMNHRLGGTLDKGPFEGEGQYFFGIHARRTEAPDSEQPDASSGMPPTGGQPATTQSPDRAVPPPASGTVKPSILPRTADGRLDTSKLTFAHLASLEGPELMQFGEEIILYARKVYDDALPIIEEARKVVRQANEMLSGKTVMVDANELARLKVRVLTLAGRADSYARDLLLILLGLGQIREMEGPYMHTLRLLARSVEFLSIQFRGLKPDRTSIESNIESWQALEETLDKLIGGAKEVTIGLTIDGEPSPVSLFYVDLLRVGVADHLLEFFLHGAVEVTLEKTDTGLNSLVITRTGSQYENDAFEDLDHLTRPDPDDPILQTYTRLLEPFVHIDIKSGGDNDTITITSKAPVAHKKFAPAPRSDTNEAKAFTQGLQRAWDVSSGHIQSFRGKPGQDELALGWRPWSNLPVGVPASAVAAPPGRQPEHPARILTIEEISALGFPDEEAVLAITNGNRRVISAARAIAGGNLPSEELLATLSYCEQFGMLADAVGLLKVSNVPLKFLKPVVKDMAVSKHMEAQEETAAREMGARGLQNLSRILYVMKHVQISEKYWLEIYNAGASLRYNYDTTFKFIQGLLITSGLKYPEELLLSATLMTALLYRYNDYYPKAISMLPGIPKGVPLELDGLTLHGGMGMDRAILYTALYFRYGGKIANAVIGLDRNQSESEAIAREMKTHDIGTIRQLLEAGVPTDELENILQAVPSAQPGNYIESLTRWRTAGWSFEEHLFFNVMLGWSEINAMTPDDVRQKVDIRGHDIDALQILAKAQQKREEISDTQQRLKQLHETYLQIHSKLRPGAIRLEGTGRSQGLQTLFSVDEQRMFVTMKVFDHSGQSLPYLKTADLTAYADLAPLRKTLYVRTIYSSDYGILSPEAKVRYREWPRFLLGGLERWASSQGFETIVINTVHGTFANPVPWANIPTEDILNAHFRTPRELGYILSAVEQPEGGNEDYYWEKLVWPTPEGDGGIDKSGLPEAGHSEGGGKIAAAGEEKRYDGPIEFRHLPIGTAIMPGPSGPSFRSVGLPPLTDTPTSSDETIRVPWLFSAPLPTLSVPPLATSPASESETSLYSTRYTERQSHERKTAESSSKTEPVESWRSAVVNNHQIMEQHLREAAEELMSTPVDVPLLDIVIGEEITAAALQDSRFSTEEKRELLVHAYSGDISDIGSAFGIADRLNREKGLTSEQVAKLKELIPRFGALREASNETARSLQRIMYTALRGDAGSSETASDNIPAERAEALYQDWEGKLPLGKRPILSRLAEKAGGKEALVKQFMLYKRLSKDLDPLPEELYYDAVRYSLSQRTPSLIYVSRYTIFFMLGSELIDNIVQDDDAVEKERLTQKFLIPWMKRLQAKKPTTKEDVWSLYLEMKSPYEW